MAAVLSVFAEMKRFGLRALSIEHKRAWQRCSRQTSARPRAPAGTPEPIVRQLYNAIAGIVATPEARAWFESLGVESGGEPPDVFAALVRAEHAKLGAVIRAAGIKAD